MFLEMSLHDKTICIQLLLLIGASMYYLGDYVKDTVHNVKGRIIRKDILYRGSGIMDPWFKEQKPKLNRSTLDQHWYEFLLEGGGASYRPEECLTQTEPFALGNKFESRYFRAEETVINI